MSSNCFFLRKFFTAELNCGLFLENKNYCFIVVRINRRLAMIGFGCNHKPWEIRLNDARYL